jgi:hypothetical protein
MTTNKTAPTADEYAHTRRDPLRIEKLRALGLKPGQPFSPVELFSLKAFTGGVLPTQVARLRDLSMGAKNTFAALVKFDSYRKVVCPSMARIGLEIGTSAKQARKYVRELERYGLIRIERRKLPENPRQNDRNRYLFVYDPAVYENVEANVRRTPDTDSTVGVESSILPNVPNGADTIGSSRYSRQGENGYSFERETNNRTLENKNEKTEVITPGENALPSMSFGERLRKILESDRNNGPNEVLPSDAVLSDVGQKKDTSDRVRGAHISSVVPDDEIPQQAREWNEVVPDRRWRLWTRQLDQALNDKLADPAFTENYPALLQKRCEIAIWDHPKSAFFTIEWVLKDNNWSKVLNGGLDWLTAGEAETNPALRFLKRRRAERAAREAQQKTMKADDKNVSGVSRSETG